MKEMSSLDIAFLMPELEKLIGARIQQIYQSEKLVRIELYSPGMKTLELIFSPGRLFLSSYKRKAASEPDMFGKVLRKRISGERIIKFLQKDFERIVEMETEQYILIFEIFSKGNAVLCDKSYSIIMPLEIQFWKGRSVKPHQKYLYPPPVTNPFGIKFDFFKELARKSEKDLVRFLASSLNLSGFYAEEICARANITKNKPCKELNENELLNVFETIHSLLKMQEPLLVCEKGKIIDAVPFSMKLYEGKELKKKSYFAEALDEYYSEEEGLEEEKKVSQEVEGKLKKFEIILERQKESLNKWKTLGEESKIKAGLIYKNYETVDKIINGINSCRENKMKWTEIKEKLKAIPIIKKVDEKKGIVTVELA